MKNMKNKSLIGAIVFSLITASAISIHLRLNTSNILIGVFAFLLFHYYIKQPENEYEYPENTKKRIRIVTLLIACLLSTFMALRGFDSFEDYPSAGVFGKLALVVVQFLGFYFLFHKIISEIYYHYVRQSYINNTNTLVFTKKKVFVICFFVLIIAWLPYYLINFPGIIISDTADQIQQALGISVYSNHHPVVQTWIIKGIFEITQSIQLNLNYAIAFYCVSQMILYALVCAYFICIIYKSNARIMNVILVVAFYALVPYNVMFTFNMWKDSLFSILVLLFSILVYEALYQEEGERRKTEWIRFVLIIVSGCGFCLLRNNGLYSFLFACPILLVALLKYNRKYILVIPIIIAITFFIRGPIFSINHVREADVVESLSIPIQQVARVISQDLEVKQEHLLLIEKTADIEKIKELYNPHISDPMKGLIRAGGAMGVIADNPVDYLRLWISLGIQYPGQYIKAFVDQTEGYWYPDVQYWMYARGVYPSASEIEKVNIIPESFEKKLEWFLWDYQNYPIIALIFSIGTAVWILFILFGMCLIKGELRAIAIMVPIVGLWITLILATPVYAEFRYIYPLFLAMPLFIFISTKNCNETRNEKDKNKDE